MTKQEQPTLVKRDGANRWIVVTLDGNQFTVVKVAENDFELFWHGTDESLGHYNSIQSICNYVA